MPKNRKIKIAFDTNIWVSFTIGKQLSVLKSVLLNPNFKVLFCDEIKDEYLDVINRPELAKYIKPERIIETLDLINRATQSIDIQSSVTLSRDADDDFLLAFSKDAKLDFLITGDKDLLVLELFEKTKIVTMSSFLSLHNLILP
jgi:uncharacterized protein